MSYLYQSNEAMFQDFDSDKAAAVVRIVDHYEVHPAFVNQYVDQLMSSQRDNPRAFAGFESEIGAFKRTVALLRYVEVGNEIAFKNSKVLDVGCGSGHSMRAAWKLGARHVIGLDYNKARADNGNKMLALYGLPSSICTGSILDTNLNQLLGSDFDLVLMFDLLEHVPSIDRSLEVARSLLKPGAKIIIRSGNPFNPEFLLREPHYGVPGMTLLSRHSALEYLAQTRGGEYEVYEWLCRTEIEERLKNAGFAIGTNSDEMTHPLADFDRVVKQLEEEFSYPTAAIKEEVLQGVKFLKILRNSIPNNEKFFGIMNYNIVAKRL